MRRIGELRRVPWRRLLVAGVVVLALSAGLARGAEAITITEFPIPTPNSFPQGITAGPDGALWFTEGNTNQIGRITTAGTITEFLLPTLSNTFGIATGPDGALWFTENPANKIGRITTAGTITEFSIPAPSRFPVAITAGPDGALWFTEATRDRILRITTAGTITEFPVGAVEITAGPDGALWFTGFDGNKIGRITTGGIITEFALPTAGSGPVGITAGPDGALWFTEVNAHKIGRITTAGTITEFPLSTEIPRGITAGPDGALWLTEAFGNKIGRITIDTAPTLATAHVRQILNVGTFVGPTVPPTPQQQQQTFRPTDPILAGATYYDPAEACLGISPAGVKLFVFTLEGQLILGRNRDTGGVSSTQIGTSKYQALLATLEPGALPPGAYTLVFWVKDCTDTAVLVSEFSALQVLSP